MTAADRYWLYSSTQEPDGQTRRQLLGRFRMLVNAKAAGSRWLSQWKKPANRRWHVVDIRAGMIIAESEAK